jgi:hypothetical protein
MIAFRMGADDARGMQRYFEPKFEEYDLVHMHNRHFVINMTIEGEKSPAFSAITLDLPPFEADETAAIIENSRSEYAMDRGSVEQYINQRYHLSGSAAPSVAPDKPRDTRESQEAVQKALTSKASAKDSAPTIGRAAVKGSNVVAKPKRKRIRNRHKKVTETDTTTDSGEHTIFLR